MKRPKRARLIQKGAEEELARLDALNPSKAPAPSDPMVTVMRDGEIMLQSPSERIPDHVWRKLARSGDSAASRLEAMLRENNFKRLKGSEQIALIRLGLEYAFGKPEAPVKRVLNVSASDSDDAVFAAMQRLAAKALLPEYKTVTDAKLANDNDDS